MYKPPTFLLETLDSIPVPYYFRIISAYYILHFTPEKGSSQFDIFCELFAIRGRS